MATATEHSGTGLPGRGQNSLRRRVIEVDHGHAGLSQVVAKEPGLRCQVSIHIGVKVQMILGQIGKGCDIESAPPHSAEFQAMGGNFHDNGLDILGSHGSKSALKVQAFGRCIDCGNFLIRVANLDGAD